MNEGNSTDKAMNTAPTDFVGAQDVEGKTMTKIIESLQKANIGASPLSETEIKETATMLVHNAQEKGEALDTENLPFDEILYARKNVREMGVPVVTGTGEVLHAQSPRDVREVIKKYNEEKQVD